ncbi:smalltalk protein [Parabacteroides distasonis]
MIAVATAIAGAFGITACGL